MRLLTTGTLRYLISTRTGCFYVTARGLLFLRALSSRRLSSSACVHETLDLPVGGSGNVSLSVIRPVASRKQSHPANSNVILLLPPGPLFQESKKVNDVGGHSTNDSSLSSGYNGALTTTPQQHSLATATSSTVVTVNYRLGEIGSAQERKKISTADDNSKENETQYCPFYKFPTPIHDTLAGFDWIQQNLQPTQLCVFGSYIGGSLALMLALTEAHSIRAVSALEPVCDWVGLDEYCLISLRGKESNTQTQTKTSNKSFPRRKKAAPPDLVPLLEARERFFFTPERYFDAFASPVLFLRAAGRGVPLTFPKCLTGPEYPVPVLDFPDVPKRQQELWDIYMQLEEKKKEERKEASDPESNGIGAQDPADADVVRRRKALSRWPPYGLDYGLSGVPNRSSRLQVTLPWVRLYARKDSPHHHHHHRPQQASSDAPKSSKGETILAQQADEMVSVMRRACFWGREKGFGEDRVQMVPVSSGTTSDTVDRMAGEWLKGILDIVQDE